MIRWHRLEHRFVKHIPEQLEPGLLYISMEFGSAAHSCCCGCGEEVVTPLTPTDWRMTYDGETVSLWPSVGNWKQRCRSHYMIERGLVIESVPWSNEDVAAERRRDRAAKARHLGHSNASEDSPIVIMPPSEQMPTSLVAEPEGWWSKVRRRLFDRKRG